jgi:hypothetical protein
MRFFIKCLFVSIIIIVPLQLLAYFITKETGWIVTIYFIFGLIAGKITNEILKEE